MFGTSCYKAEECLQLVVEVLHTSRECISGSSIFSISSFHFPSVD